MDEMVDLRLLLATIPAIFFRGFKDWSVVFLDDKITQMTGYDAREFNERKKKWLDLVLPEDVDTLKASVKQAWRSTGSYVREYRILDSSGKILWIQECSRLVIDSLGDIQSIIGFFFDITERKTLELELARTVEELKRVNLNLEDEARKRTKRYIQSIKESMKRFRLLFQNTKDLILIGDARWRLSDLNPSAVGLLGYESESELIGRSIAELFPSRSLFADRVQELLKHTFAEDWETQFVRKDGSLLDVAISADLVYDELRNVTGINIVAKEMSEWRKMLERSLHTQKMATVGQMAAGIAHELNTPLMVILAHSQLLQDDFDRESEVYESLKTIEGQIHICRRIVRDLLEFSRREPTTYELLNLHEVLEDVLKVMGHSLALDRIEILRHYDPRYPWVEGNTEKLKRVFINILQNAHQAIATDGVILIRTSLDEHHRTVQVVIADSGPGISAEIRGRVFEPFFSTKQTGQGTGLGLALTRAIVEEHNGVVAVESPLPDELLEIMKESMQKPLGSGAAFTTRFPVLSSGPLPPCLQDRDDQ